jgi:CRP-like cAMP-binding protein
MEERATREALLRCGLFKGLEEDRLKALSEAATHVIYEPGALIYEKGSPSGGTFCLILSGEAEALSEQGVALRKLGQGQVIGEIGATSPQQKRTVTLRAIQRVELLEWKAGELVDQIPELIKRLKDLAWKRVSDWYE